jgi:sugar phosphate isomerase/epimerase
VPCIHLKDYAYGGKMAVVGEGNLNFDRIFEKAESAQTQYLLVEQDDCGGEDPFACLRRSYRNLVAMGFRE